MIVADISRCLYRGMVSMKILFYFINFVLYFYNMAAVIRKTSFRYMIFGDVVSNTLTLIPF